MKHASYTTLLTERTGAVLKITTNRPEVLNAQSRILLEELDDAFKRAVDDDAVRVDRKSTRLNSSHRSLSRMPSSA